MGRYGVNTRLACIVAKAADIQWDKMLIVSVGAIRWGTRSPLFQTVGI